MLPDTPAARKAGRRGGLLPTGAVKVSNRRVAHHNQVATGGICIGRPAVGHCTTARLDGDIEGGGWKLRQRSVPEKSDR